MFNSQKFKEIQIEHMFFDFYWEYFEGILATRKSRDEIFNLYESELFLQENKLSQYQKQYNQNHYTNDYILLSKQIELYNELKRRFNEEFPIVKSLGMINPLKLNYGDKNEEVVEILYQGLYPEFIEVGKEVFYQHFFGGTIDPIQWKVSESSFVYLFKNIKWEKFNIWEGLAEHFTNKKGKTFNPKQLSNVASKQEYQNRVALKHYIDDIVEKLKNIKSI